MPRSSRHKSSKHSSREYSDSEKDSSSLKERKGREESGSARVLKESGSGEKRKLDLKDSGNGEYVEEYTSSSKRRKEKGAEDGASDRWNGGGEEDGRGEVSKKVKEKTSESKNRKRDDSVEKSAGKSEGRHKDSSGRKEGRESKREKERERDRERERERERDKEKEKERKGKEGRGEKAGDGDDLRASKQVSERIELNVDTLRKPELENNSDRRLRRKRDSSVDVDVNERRFSSREDVVKDGRTKDEKNKDGRYRDKHHDEMVRENRHQDDKQRDEHATRDIISSRFDEKQPRDGKDNTESRQKKSKPLDGDRDFDVGRDRNRDHDRDRDDQDQEHGHDHDRDLDWDRKWDKDRGRERDHSRIRDHDRERDRDRNIDYDAADDRNARYKDSRGRKRSPDDRDEYNDAKSRDIKTPYLHKENKSLSSTRVEADIEKAGRSQSRQSHLDSNVSVNRRRTSPDTNSHGPAEEYRHLKYRDAMTEHRSKAVSSREGGTSERTSKYRSIDKPMKMDDGYGGELTLERSSSSKASPVGLRDRSPSSSLERRYANRSGARRSLEIEESGRRNSGSIGVRDLPAAEDRQGWEDKPLQDELTPADVNYYRSNPSNPGLIPLPPFRGRGSSPSFMGSLDDDNRVHSGSRYKRGSDPSLGRGQGNAWRGAPPPNWSSPVPNGYIPFQHGPVHGGFQGLMPHFPSPPLFAVRPPMEINHSGIPYHIPDTDRFSGHVRPLAWQNMMDGSGPSQLHGWDGNNGAFRDEGHMYGGVEWDQNRHPMTGRGWESTGADMWEGQNGDANLDMNSAFNKESITMQAPLDDSSSLQSGQLSEKYQQAQAETVETKKAVASFSKESFKSSPKILHEKLTDPSMVSSDNNKDNICRAYLSKLNISTELSGPELYRQCMTLLGGEQSFEEGSVMLVDLKDGARAVPKASKLLLDSSLFLPMTNNSVFERAMDIYKKQRVSLYGTVTVSGGSMDVSKSKVELVSGDANKEDEILEDEGVHEATPLNFDDNKKETLADTEEGKSKETVSTSNLELVRVDNYSPVSEMADQSLGHDSLEKAGQDDDTIDRVSPDLELISEDAKGECQPSVNDVAPEVVSTLESEDHNLVETGKVKENTVGCPEEGQRLDDGTCGPLFFSDGSPKASGDLMPGSNGSESVILTRIHHSPENTH